MNRGLARRVAFPDRLHIRYFLACIARAVRRGEIEAHVVCVLTTHVHLLVRSTRGLLSEALRRVFSSYVRFYNRKHPGRDGPLFRGRFRSRPVLSTTYRHILVRYIENNSVDAGLARHPAEYPYGSAAWRRRTRPPRWLAAWWVKATLSELRRNDRSATYESHWCAGLPPVERDLVRNRIRSPAHPQDPLDDLVGAAPARVRDWMERQARLADGHGARAPLVPPNVVTRVLLEARRQWGAWTSRAAHGPDCDLWPAVTAGLLRHLAGLTRVHVAQLLNVGPTRAGLLLERHRGQMTSAAYAERAAALAGRCLRALAPGARSAAAPRAPGPAELPAAADSRPVSTGV